MQVFATFLCAAAVFLRSIYAQIPMNLTFSPWQVMGPVDTTGTGYAILTYVGGELDYEFHLFNVRGLQSIELHVGMQTEHGDVAAVFYKAPFANASQVSNGRVAAGTLTSYDLLGPFLLPLGNHLEVSMVYNGYITEGLATVVVHTLVNPGGELGAYPSSMISSAPIGAPMNMGMAGMSMP